MKSLLLLTCLFTTLAHAQLMPRADFLRLTDDQKSEFLGKYAEEKPITASQRSSAVFKTVKALALKVSDVWYDTILEGPYVMTDEPELGESNALIVNKQIYAYRFTVRAPAFFTEGEGCELDEETDVWTDVCLESSGYITEPVMFDFKGTRIDDGSYAEFDS